MDHAAGEEKERPRRQSRLRDATNLLDQALRLRHVDPAESSLLRACVDSAIALRQSIRDASPARELAPEIRQIAEGAHPIAALLRLAGSGADLPDAEWAKLHREVSAAYGKPIAAAAARKRLGLAPVRPEEPKSQVPTATSAPTSVPAGPAAVTPPPATHEVLDTVLNRMHRPAPARIGSGLLRDLDLPKREG